MWIPKRSATSAAAVLVACLLIPQYTNSQEPTDTVAGHVTVASGQPAPAAEVVVTPVGTPNSVSVRTDSAGRFIAHTSIAPKYLIFVRAADGATKRMVADRSSTGRTEVNLVLEPVQALPPVRVESRRSPNLGSRLSSAFGQSETDVDLIGGVVPPSEQGTLAAALTLVPGAVVNADGSGFSVLGLGSGQNRVTFNGALVERVALPRSTPVVTRMNSSPSDVSKGGFSGALVSIEPRQAGNFITTNIGVSGQQRLSTANDRLSRLSRNESNVLVDFAHTGPIEWNKLAYTVSGQAGKRTTPVASLLDLDQSLLGELGIGEAGVAQLQTALTSAGIPVVPIFDDRNSTTNEGSLVARVDYQPARARNTSITALAGFSNVDALGVGPSSIANDAFSSHAANHSIQLEDERTVHASILNDARFGYSADYRDRKPYLQFPGGNVLLPSIQSSEPIVPAVFGGAGYAKAFDQSLTFNFSNSASWYSKDGTHLRKATIEAEQETIRNEAGANTLGQYTFLNIADIASNDAVSFSRDIGSSISRGAFSTLSASLGDTWENDSGFSVQYGLRMDAFRAAPQFAFVPPADEPLPGSLQLTPKWTFGLSPRFGFARTYSFGNPPPGSVARRIVLSGGSGLFRSTGAESVLNPLRQAGWRSALSSKLFCIGDAVPQPDWRAFAASTQSIPSQCAQTSPLVRDSSSSLAFLGRDFSPPFSWRTNISASTRLGSIRVAVEGILSLNRSQTDLSDINQIDTPRFLLSKEGSRPVFVDASAINKSGAFSTATNRVDPAYGPIWNAGSDATSISRQLGINLLSANPSLVSRRSWQISYVHSWVATRQKGFGGSTVGDPREFQTTQGLFQTTHQFILRGSSVLGRSEKIEISGFIRVNSGFRFTPLVASDINGDGVPNDRAWIFAPTGNDSVSSGIMRLLNSGPRYVKSCIAAQVNRFAGAQSCTGPWSTSSTLNIAIRGDAFRLPSRSHVVLSIVNPIALTDRLIHGDNTRGWGQTSFVDPYLYSVKGFVAETKQFVYAVNPNFGSTFSVRSFSRNPFQVSLSLSLPVGPTWGAQTVETDLAPGRWRAGTRKTADDLLNQHIGMIIGFDPLARIGSGGDSVKYTAAQLRALRSAIATRDSALRSIFHEAAEFGASVGPEPTKEERDRLVSLRKTATDSAVVTLIETGRAVTAALTPDQIDKLSAAAKSFLDRDDILHLRRLGFFVY